MLNPAEHENLEVISIKISSNSAFLGSDKPRILFSRAYMLKWQQLLAF